MLLQNSAKVYMYICFNFTLLDCSVDIENYIFKEFENLSVEKKALSTALGFEPRSFDCRSSALTTELHRRPISPSPQEDLLISPSGSALRL